MCRHHGYESWQIFQFEINTQTYSSRAGTNFGSHSICIIAILNRQYRIFNELHIYKTTQWIMVTCALSWKTNIFNYWFRHKDSTVHDVGHNGLSSQVFLYFSLLESEAILSFLSQICSQVYPFCPQITIPHRKITKKIRTKGTVRRLPLDKFVHSELSCFGNRHVHRHALYSISTTVNHHSMYSSCGFTAR